jgi:hypothetical protein
MTRRSIGAMGSAAGMAASLRCSGGCQIATRLAAAAVVGCTSSSVAMAALLLFVAYGRSRVFVVIGRW